MNSTTRQPRTIPPKVRFGPGHARADDELLLLALRDLGRHKSSRADMVYSSVLRKSG
ncbi:hypothetical protein ACFVHW_04220 [Streptomyces sp. NPDC127110]|uniref:hypothetical protein n=1 Tax=Streptomyces sp. NPDC127110 TaxID=3345362 RepID=UPI003625CCEE